jgi:hypothetical protein
MVFIVAHNLAGVQKKKDTANSSKAALEFAVLIDVQKFLKREQYQ